MDLTIVIPCYNEADNIAILQTELAPVVSELRLKQSVEVVFVDDGSVDGTGDLVQSCFRDDPLVRVVRHDRNRGLGAALRTGFRNARGDVVVTTDSDATYAFTLIPTILDYLGPDVGVVTSSCYHPAGGVENVPAYRLLLSKSASLIYRIILDRHVHTYTSMFRVYRREVIETVPFFADGFLSVTELLANAMLMGYVVREMPCTLRVRRYGASKAKIARTIVAHLRFQGKLVADRLRSRPIVMPVGTASRKGT